MASVADELEGPGAPGGWIELSEGELLLVDDDPRILKLLARRFRRVFRRVHLASTAKEADRLIRSHPISHIVCDYHLRHPWANGMDLLCAWRREFIKIDRAVLYTGASAAEIGEVPEEIDAVIQKGESLELIMVTFAFSRAPPG